MTCTSRISHHIIGSLMHVDALFKGSAADGAEEIKRHGFFSTIDWNVSVSLLSLMENTDL